MSLNWNLTQVENSETLCWIPSTEEEGKFQMNGVTEVLIWSTILVGFSKITEKNYKTFFRRAKELEVVYGMRGFLVEAESTRMPYIHEVQKHIGLKTNADILTNRKWGSHLRRQIEFTTNELIAREKELEDVTAVPESV